MPLTTLPGHKSVISCTKIRPICNFSFFFLFYHLTIFTSWRSMPKTETSIKMEGIYYFMQILQKYGMVRKKCSWRLTNPIFSAPERFWKATPATLSPMMAGPPLFPGLIAASIWIAISCAAPCAYCVGSTLETTPFVTDMLSPPIKAGKFKSLVRSS